MSDKIRLGNFQGFHGLQEASIAPITLIFGPNASGKSSIGRALRLFAQTIVHGTDEVRGGLLFDGPLVELGSYSETIFAHKNLDFAPGSGNPTGILVSLRFPMESSVSGMIKGFTVTLWQHERVPEARWAPRDDTQSPSFVVTIGFEGLPLDAWYISFDHSRFQDMGIPGDAFSKLAAGGVLDGSDIADLFQHAELGSKSIINFPVSGPMMNLLMGVETPTAESVGRAASMPIMVNRLVADGGIRFDGLRPRMVEEVDDFLPAFSDTSNITFLRNLGIILGEVSDVLSANFEHFSVVKPLRELPEAVSILPSQVDLDKEGLRLANRWLGKLTDGRYKLHVRKTVVGGARNREVISRWISDSFTRAEISFGQVGTGLSQVLPVIIAAFKLDKHTQARNEGAGQPTGGTVLIEQPELHLHPRMQADLADLFVDARAHSGSQYIIETHSENLLLRFQKLIRAGKLNSSDFTVVYSEATAEDLAEDTKNVRERDRDREKHRFNVFYNISLDHAGDVIDPFPLSFSDLRIQDLID